MAYTKKTWENLPSTNAPLSATGMNDLENRIANGFNIIDFLGIPASEITAEDDLNDFVDEGAYIFKQETTDTPSHMPPRPYLSPFKLLVLNFPDYYDSESKVQIYIGFGGPVIYIRETQPGPSIQWLSWKKIALNSDLGDNYSTSEQVIGTWMGKPLYRKVFTITSLTSSNTNLVNVSGLSIDFAKISGTIITSTGAKFPINLYDSASNYSVIILSDAGYIRGRGVIGSGTLTKCIVILEYTKTTD